MQERRQIDPLPDIKKPNALGPVKFMTAGAEKIDMPVLRPYRQLSKRLDGIRMEDQLVLL